MGFKLTSPPPLLLSKVDPRMKYHRDKDEMQRPLALSPSLLAREYGHQEYLQLGTN